MVDTTKMQPITVQVVEDIAGESSPILPTTAFGEIQVAEPTPIVQCQFPYNINTDIIEKRENNAGTITQSQSMAVIQSGASNNSAAHMLSRVPLKYGAGQGLEVRLSALFTPGVSGSVQIAGIGEVGDGLFIGFNGLDFAIDRREQGIPEIQTLTVTSGGGAGNITITLDGVDKIVTLGVGDTTSRLVAIKIAAADFSDIGLGWTTKLNNATVIFKAWSDGNKTGNFTFDDTGSTTAAADFAETVSGVTTINNWVNQKDWNIDGLGHPENPKNPSGMLLDPTKLNVYIIPFQYLGSGAMVYKIESDTKGTFLPFHRINYSNKNIIPSFQNPTLPLHIMSKNLTNTSNLTVKSGSMAGFVQGKESDIGLIKGADNSKDSVGTTQTNILSIKNNFVYQGKENRTKVRIDGINISSEGTKLVTIRITKNTILGGTPVFTDINSNTSVIAKDTAGTTLTGGTEILAIQLGRTDSKEIPLKEFKLDLLPGELITISGASASASTSDIGASIHWRELF